MRYQNPDGLCMASVRINEDGVVQYEGVKEWVNIIHFTAVVDALGETYTDANGVEINVRRMVNHMKLTEQQYDNIRSADSYDIESDVIYDSRSEIFLRYLENHLKGVADFSRRTK